MNIPSYKNTPTPKKMFDLGAKLHKCQVNADHFCLSIRLARKHQESKKYATKLHVMCLGPGLTLADNTFSSVVILDFLSK